MSFGRPTLQESADTYTLVTLQTNGLPFKVKVNDSTHQPNNYAAISYVTATWEQNMRGINGNIDARTGIRVRAFNSSWQLVATFYDNFTGSNKKPTWGVGYKNVQNHSFSLDLISNGTGNATVLYKDGTKYNGEWTNQDLVMSTRDLVGSNLVYLFSTNYKVPSTSTWSFSSTLDQPITEETWIGGDLYFVRIKDLSGSFSANIGSTNVRIDKTKPTPKATFDADTGTFRDQSTDALSGVKLTQIKITEVPQTSDWTNIDDVTITTPGRYVFVIRTTENAGNVEQAQMVVEMPLPADQSRARDHSRVQARHGQYR